MSADYSQLLTFQTNLTRLSEDMRQEFIEACAKELAARLLTKVIKRTPVGQYKDKVGGTLRRGWTAGKGATQFCKELRVNHFGGTYVIEIINPVEYASYVEYGHRTRDHKGWVNGKFMLTISENEIRADMPNILERKLKKKLKEVLP